MSLWAWWFCALAVLGGIGWVTTDSAIPVLLCGWCSCAALVEATKGA